MLKIDVDKKKQITTTLNLKLDQITSVMVTERINQRKKYLIELFGKDDSNSIKRYRQNIQFGDGVQFEDKSDNNGKHFQEMIIDKDKKIVFHPIRAENDASEANH